VPIGESPALQALRDKGRIQPGQKVLINAHREVWVRSRADRQVIWRRGDRRMQYQERWLWSDQSAQIKSLITPTRILPKARNATPDL